MFIPSNSAGGNPPSPADTWKTTGFSSTPPFPYVMHVETVTQGADACDNATLVNNSSPMKQYFTAGYAPNAGVLRWHMTTTGISKECATTSADVTSFAATIDAVLRGTWERHVRVFQAVISHGHAWQWHLHAQRRWHRPNVGINDSLKIDRRNAIIGLNNANDNLGLDMGMYFSYWEDHDPSPNTDVMVMYIDELRVCDQTVDSLCEYASVGPYRRSGGEQCHHCQCGH